jgi:hypothetical protein
MLVSIRSRFWIRCCSAAEEITMVRKDRFRDRRGSWYSGGRHWLAGFCLGGVFLSAHGAWISAARSDDKTPPQPSAAASRLTPVNSGEGPNPRGTPVFNESTRSFGYVSEDGVFRAAGMPVYNRATRTAVSPGGLVYGPDAIPRDANGRSFGNRVAHVFDHLNTKPKFPKKSATHSRFNTKGRYTIDLLDEAWAKRGNPLPGQPGTYVIDMGRPVGTAGERQIKLVVAPGSAERGAPEVTTAFPFKPKPSKAGTGTSSKSSGAAGGPNSLPSNSGEATGVAGEAGAPPATGPESGSVGAPAKQPGNLARSLTSGVKARAPGAFLGGLVSYFVDRDAGVPPEEARERAVKASLPFAIPVVGEAWGAYQTVGMTTSFAQQVVSAFEEMAEHADSAPPLPTVEDALRESFVPTPAPDTGGRGLRRAWVRPETFPGGEFVPVESLPRPGEDDQQQRNDPGSTGNNNGGDDDSAIKGQGNNNGDDDPNNALVERRFIVGVSSWGFPIAIPVDGTIDAVGDGDVGNGGAMDGQGDDVDQDDDDDDGSGQDNGDDEGDDEGEDDDDPHGG